MVLESLFVGLLTAGSGGLGLLVEPIFEFAVGLAKLQLDQTELALLAAVLLMQSGTWRHQTDLINRNQLYRIHIESSWCVFG